MYIKNKFQKDKKMTDKEYMNQVSNWRDRQADIYFENIYRDYTREDLIEIEFLEIMKSLKKKYPDLYFEEMEEFLNEFKEENILSYTIRELITFYLKSIDELIDFHDEDEEICGNYMKMKNILAKV